MDGIIEASRVSSDEQIRVLLGSLNSSHSVDHIAFLLPVFLPHRVIFHLDQLLERPSIDGDDVTRSLAEQFAKQFSDTQIVGLGRVLGAWQWDVVFLGSLGEV